MTLDADAIVARRIIRRKLTFWRIVAVAIFCFAVLGFSMLAGGGKEGRFAYRDHVARIHIDGLITGDEKTLDLIAKVADEPRVKAVIVRIDSPGGTTVGSEAVYEALTKLAKDKQVVAVMDTVAASGGYIAALPAHHIVARGNTVTGSIGVIFTWPDASKLFDMVGVKMDEIKSGELKAEPTPFHPASPRVREVTQAMVADSYDWFVGLVASNRRMSRERAIELADGRVYTGRQALKEGLIDEIGGEDQARNWLKTARNVPLELETEDYKPPADDWAGGFGALAFRRALNLMGLGGLEKVLVPERLSLDGLQSVWHP